MLNLSLKKLWEDERQDTQPEIPTPRPDLPNGMVNILQPQSGDTWVLELRDWYRLTGWSLLLGFGDSGSFSSKVYVSSAAEWMAGVRTLLYGGADPATAGPYTEIDISAWSPLLFSPGDILSGVLTVSGTVTLAGLTPWLRRLPYQRTKPGVVVVDLDGNTVVDLDGNPVVGLR